ncbi:hypothetical protein F5Y06DRAFT_74836 [Hypoxylon sp. FL0890]|nr:hypothetical protein F5Y06DRAFT_74836 [Hypoxylon sp. FL0890]
MWVASWHFSIVNFPGHGQPAPAPACRTELRCTRAVTLVFLLLQLLASALPLLFIQHARYRSISPIAFLPYTLLISKW